MNSLEYIEFEIVEKDNLIEDLVDLYKANLSLNRNNAYLIEIETALSDFIDIELKENLYFIIEYPYVDKVYRDSFYSYFSSKHYKYDRDCIRVSIFSETLDPQDFFDVDKHLDIKKKYLGYFVLRPLKTSIFGRSHISLKAFQNLNCRICTYESEIMLFGLKMKSSGFPHSSQDSETISCAETTIWGLMEYFGNKYAEYRPTLPSKIIETLKSVSFQRQLPSNGLTINQISFALKEYGFGTRIYSREAYSQQDLFEIINDYLESGIPTVLGLETDNLAHAVIAVGKSTDFDGTPLKKEICINNIKIKYFDWANWDEQIIIQDDNNSPYTTVKMSNVGYHYQEGSEESKYKIRSIIVPLYSKIYLEAKVAKSIFLQIIKDSYLGYRFSNNFIFKMFLASSRSYKAHLMIQRNLNGVLKEKLLKIKMPKFIWCAEVFQKEKTINIDSKVSSLLILDATETNHKTLDPIIFLGYPNRSIFITDKKIIPLAQVLSGLKSFTNLK